MIEDRVLTTLEYPKVCKLISEFLAISKSKREISESKPSVNFGEASLKLKKTAEAFKLLYTYGVSGIEYFDDIGDIPEKAMKGATLSMGELLKVARLLRSGRVFASGINAVKDDSIIYLRQIAGSVFTDLYLENEITTKILSEDLMSDNASEKLASLRKNIKKINEQIREKISQYLRTQSKYLQENIFTVRNDRYVLPVKSECKGQVRGFIHDQSSTGSTVYIEPEAVLELDNELKSEILSEQAEVERILAELSEKVGMIADKLKYNVENIVDADICFGKAEYAYKTHSVMPILNNNGVIDIRRGRHPLIDPKKVVPVSLSIGKNYNFLLITGPNTGGKTVSLKMVGLFTLMAMDGIFVPADDGTEISVFDKIFCDVGDEQSIEQSLSTFSSHMKNIIKITTESNEKSLVFIDEIGAGTDPDEGSALARAVIEDLLDKKSYGIITTHYSSLKEYAYTEKRIMNASMEFDSKTFAPLYKINIGMPGSSNAIEISKMLGLNPALADKACNYLSDNKVSFEQVLKEAEKSRQEAEQTKAELEAVKAEEQTTLEQINKEKARFNAEKEKFYAQAKIESRRIVNQRLEEADNIVTEMRTLFDKEELTGGDLIKVRTLRNQLENKKYSLEDTEENIVNYEPAKIENLKENDSVYYKPMESVCTVGSVNSKKNEADIFMGSVRMTVNVKDLYFVHSNKVKTNTTVALHRETLTVPVTEINVIGENVMEALPEIELFIDQAIVNNLEEIKIIHGKGMKILSTAVHDMLKRNKSVVSYRFGNYGEGEHGVTFVKLK